MIHRSELIGLLVVLSAGITTGCQSVQTLDWVIADVTLVDPVEDTLIFNQSVGVKNGLIVKVGASVDGAELRADEEFDGDGLYLIPGLWDMHVHALWDSSVAPYFLAEFVKHGVVGIRDMGGDLSVVQEYRQAQAKGWKPWPTIVAAGPILDGPEPVDPSISWAISTSKEAEAAVDKLSDLGVDFIKVYTLLPREAYFAVLHRAEEKGLAVAGHVPAGVSVSEAVDAGQRSLEHLRDEFEILCSNLDERACDTLLRRMGTLGVHNTPTLAVLEAKSIPGYRRGEGADARSDLPEGLRQFWQEARERHLDRSPEYFRSRQSIFSQVKKLVHRLLKNGAPLLAGSDTGNPYVEPGVSLHRELELMVDSGLSPAEALQTATTQAAEFLGLNSPSGALREGDPADWVLLRGNPLEDISQIRSVAGVVLKGRWVRELQTSN